MGERRHHRREHGRRHRRFGGNLRRVNESTGSGLLSWVLNEAAIPPPALGRRLLDAWFVAIIGTVAWFVAFLLLLLLGVGDVWIYTGLAGAVVGLLGMGLMYWQQSASRRGSRSAQRGL